MGVGDEMEQDVVDNVQDHTPDEGMSCDAQIA